MRAAVLYGSVARGRERAGSDLDLIVVLRRRSLAALADLETKLMDVVGRDVRVVELDQALQDAPRLVMRALGEGRVLVDRDGWWAALRANPRPVRAAVRRQARLLADELGSALQALERM